MAARIGINPLTWSNDDNPALGGDISLEQCLSEAAAAGYAGVELGNKFPREAKVLRPLLEEHGLALVSGWYSAELLQRTAAQELTAMEAHLGLLEALGCTVMVVAETSGKDFNAPRSARPRLSAGDWPRFCDRLSEVAGALRERGMGLAYHHHMGTVVETEDEIERLLAGTGDAVGLLLDTGHLTYARGDVLGVARRHAARINHVHCKDIRPAVLEDVLSRDGSFLDSVPRGVFTVPGDSDGCVDYPALLAVLKAADYGGWLVVEAEQDPAQAHPLTYARMGFAALHAAAQRAGL